MKWPEINKKLLYFKLHFLIAYGGLGGMYPYHAIIGKNIGITATAIGFTFTAVTGLNLLLVPLIGAAADYFRNLKAILISLILTCVAASLCLILIPPIELNHREQHNSTQNDSQNWTDCHNLTDSLQSSVGQLSTVRNTNQIEGLTPQYLKVNDTLLSWNSSNSVSNTKGLNGNAPNPQLQYRSTAENSNCTENSTKAFLRGDKTMSTDFSMGHSKLDNEKISAYVTYQYWTFTMLLIISNFCSQSFASLSNVACYSALGDKPQDYGRQRLYGTIGWALVCSLSGYLNDMASGDQDTKSFMPGFCILATLLVLDSAVLCRMSLSKGDTPRSSFRDINKVLGSFDGLVFAAAVVVIGILTFIPSGFEYWFLQELGAGQMLLGAATMVQCLGGEMPFFIVSGWFVKKFGCVACLVGSFLGFSLRLGAYAVITDPAWALLIDLSHGVTFAMFYAGMTAYANSEAPPGLEATMFNVLCALNSGLGTCIGGLIVGASIDSFGHRFTFTTASVTSCVCAFAVVFLHLMSRTLSKKTETSKFGALSGTHTKVPESDTNS